MHELEQLRLERTEAWEVFVAESGRATRATIKAQAARKRYMLINEEVRAQERDLLAYPIN
jgi:hypothetical protein